MKKAPAEATAAPRGTDDAVRRPWPHWPGWRHLPRDARDTLFLLGVIAWTVLPHVGRLPAWCTALAALMLLWRARLALSQGALPARGIMIATLALAVGLTAWTHGSLLGRDPGVTLAVVLMALKTLELRARRDTFVVFFLGFFLVLTHFLYSQTLLIAAAMLVSVWGLLTALVLAHIPAGEPSLRQAGGLALRTAVFGAPIMVLLFALFPRIGPLWGVPQDLMTKSGLSGTMRLGSIAEVALDDNVALRIRFPGPAPAPQSLYLRGPVLSAYDGVEWRARPPALAQLSRNGATLTPLGAPIAYEMTLEPSRLPHLPLLEATTEAPDVSGLRVYRTDDLQFIADRPVFERLRLRAEAHASYRLGPLQRPADGLREYLDLPDGHNPRTIAWAQALRAVPALAGGDAGALAAAVLRHVGSGGYAYTLAPGAYLGTDAIDQFWLDRREGFCEHYAAAFVVIMRSLGVPARIVTGYQGADPDPIDGYYVVRNSSAHAWAEYWQAGAGWVRADPTAEVAPERIRRSANLRPAPGLLAGAVGNVSPELLAQLRRGWEALNNRWNQTVLNYSRTDQFDLLQRLGLQAPTWEDLAVLMVGALSLLALAGAAWAWWDRRRMDPWQRQRERLRRALGRAGIQAGPADTPRELAQRVRARHGTQGTALADLLDTLERQRYSRAALDRPQAGLTRRFVQLARGLVQDRR